MITKKFRRLSRFGLLLPVMLCASCSRAPSFDILGSFFPAWLLCLVLGLVLTTLTYQLIMRAHVALAVPVLTYPSLVALFTFALWLAFFR